MGAKPHPDEHAPAHRAKLSLLEAPGCWPPSLENFRSFLHFDHRNKRGEAHSPARSFCITKVASQSGLVLNFTAEQDRMRLKIWAPHRTHENTGMGRQRMGLKSRNVPFIHQKRGEIRPS